MALKEPILAGGTSLTAGTLYVVNDVPTVCPNSGASTVSAWQSTIGGSPVIRSCDVPGRTHGAFLPSGSPFNMNLLLKRGCEIFES